MTDDSAFKKQVRARMAETGENYTVARRAVIAGRDPGQPPVALRVYLNPHVDLTLTEGTARAFAAADEQGQRDMANRLLADHIELAGAGEAGVTAGSEILTVQESRIDEIVDAIHRRIPRAAGISTIAVGDDLDYVQVDIQAARPGVAHGHGGAGLDRLRAELEELTGKPVHVHMVREGPPKERKQIQVGPELPPEAGTDSGQRSERPQGELVDITQLILDDHHEQRRLFAILEQVDRSDTGALSAVWGRLAAFLELHAAAEEAIFYPALLRAGIARRQRGEVEDETLDAIHDHNDIRDAVQDVARHAVGSDQWYAAVAGANLANSDHMAEEEREGLTDFRRFAGLQQRHDLAVEFVAYEARNFAGVQPVDKDPAAYVSQAEHDAGRAGDGSLGIGRFGRP